MTSTPSLFRTQSTITIMAKELLGACDLCLALFRGSTGLGD